MRPSNIQVARAFVLSMQTRNQYRASLELAAYLLETNSVDRLDDILSNISVELRNQYGIVEADVVSARAMSDNIRQNIIAYIKQTTQAEHVNVQESIDVGLIGGVIINTPDYELDLSLKTKLAKLGA